MPEECPANYIFILTPIAVEVPVPYEVLPGHHLRRATDCEVEEIRDYLMRHDRFRMPGYPNPYEYDVVRLPDAGNTKDRMELRPIDRERWRYWVVGFQGPGLELGALESAAELNDPEIAFGFTFTSIALPQAVVRAPGLPTVLIPFLSQGRYPFVEERRIREKDLKEIGRIYSLLKALPNDESDVRRALRMLYDLRQLHPSSRFHTLGLFSAIEALVVHHQKSTEVGDSILHQISTKLPLLQKRFCRRVDIATYFPQQNLSESKLWKSLYDYRSTLVHGSEFGKTPKHFVSNPVAAEQFLREVVKCLVILGMEDRGFLEDLKKC